MSSPAPDPVAPPPYTPLPPPARKRRWWIPVVIVAGLLVIVLLIVAGLGIFRAVTSFMGPTAPDQPLVEGSPGSPVAVTPLECDTPCYTEASVEASLPDESEFAGLGIPDATFPAGTYPPSQVSDLFRRSLQGWESYNGEPDSCFFAPENSPTSASVTSTDSESTDLIYFNGTHENTDFSSTMDQAVRVFADSASAEDYMTTLASSIAGCDSLEIGPAGDRYSAEIDAAPELDVPDSVAAIGWIRTGVPGMRWRAYIIDMQHGNLVIRTRLLTDGGVTEAEFREFVEARAVELGALPVETP